MKKKIIPPLNITFEQGVQALVKERPKKKTKKKAVKRSNQGAKSGLIRPKV